MEVGPADPAFLIGESMSGTEVEAKSAGLFVQLNGDHVKVEEISKNDLLQALVESLGPFPLIQAFL
jgi:hypothetical protein